MKLLTKAIERKLAPLYDCDGKAPEDIRVPLKLFNPCGSQTWYLWEKDPDSDLCFGLFVDSHGAELGYTSLDELSALRVKPFGLGIERDMHWSGTAADAAKTAGYSWPGRD